MDYEMPSDKKMESCINWDDVFKIIPQSNNTHNPIHIIRSCLEETHGENPYDQIDKQLDRLIQEIQKHLQEITQ